MRGRIFLGGGGSDADEARLWAEAFPAGSTVAVWPFAQVGAEGRRAASAWMTSALEKLGHYSVRAWVDLHASEYALHGVDVVAVPGGNTFLLLRELRSLGLLEVLQDFLQDGGRFYGGSAGAVLAGKDIGIASAADSNDVGLEDFRGLDVIGGLDVLPHYTPDQEQAATDHVNHTSRPVLCLPETSGVVVGVDGSLWNVGPSLAYVVHGHRTDIVEVG